MMFFVFCTLDRGVYTVLYFRLTSLNRSSERELLVHTLASLSADDIALGEEIYLTIKVTLKIHSSHER